MSGGVASGFHHVTTNDGGQKRLFQVKGKRNVRVREIGLSVSNMNKGEKTQNLTITYYDLRNVVYFFFFSSLYE